MDPDHWQQIKALLDSATLERAPGERFAFLDEACVATNASLRNEVESLIASHEQASGFIEVTSV